MRRTTWLVMATLAVIQASSQAGFRTESAKLLPDHVAPGDFFGQSVALDESLIIVGAPGDDDDGSKSGSTSLFHTDSGRYAGKLVASDASEGDLFGTSAAISAGTIIVGALGDGDNGEFSGSAYLFDSATQQQIARLAPDDGAPFNYFGVRVAIDGTMAVVGAYGADDQSGAVYVFNITSRRQIAKLLPGVREAGQDFGLSVAISGATVVVGAPFEDADGVDAGAAYLFDLQSGRQTFRLVADDIAPADLFGWDVAISGTTAIIASRQDDNENGVDSGSAYLFDTTTGRQIRKLLPIDGAANDQFGHSVGISDTAAIVGAHFDSDNGLTSGSAYVFETTTGQLIAKLLPSDGQAFDNFGISAAIGRATAVVGAYLDDDHGTSTGSAYLFHGVTGDLRCQADITQPPDGEIGFADLVVLLHCWGDPAPDCNDADLTGDGDIDFVDLLGLLSRWGPCP